MKERLEIPQEIADIAIRRSALADLRDLYVRIPFGFRNARKAAMESKSGLAEFWKKVGEIYPQTLDGRTWEFSVTGGNYVYLKDEQPCS